MRLIVLLLAIDWFTVPVLAQQAELSDRSVERVRTSLAKPPSKLTMREPDFRVRVEAKRPLSEIFEAPPWAVERSLQPRYVIPASPFGSQPLVSINLLPIANLVVDEIRSMKRARAESGARREVDEAIRFYCAAQPNNGAGIQMCDK